MSQHNITQAASQLSISQETTLSATNDATAIDAISHGVSVAMEGTHLSHFDGQRVWRHVEANGFGD